MSELDTYWAYDMANLVMSGVIIIPLSVIWVMSLFTARRRRDPARSATVWLKVGIPFEVLSIILNVAADACSLVAIDIENDDDFFDNSNNAVDEANLFQAADYLADVGTYAEEIATVLVLVALVGTGVAFLYVLQATNKGRTIAAAGSKPFPSPLFHKILWFAAFGAALVLFAIATGLFGHATSDYVSYYNIETANLGGNYSAINAAIDAYDRSVYVSRQLGSAYDIINWILSMALVVLGAFAVHQSRGSMLISSAILYLVATLLWFVRFTWHLAYDAAWELPKSSEGVPVYFNAIDPILNLWAFFIVMVLLYVIYSRRQLGLWTTPQPWMASAPAAPVAPVAAYSGNNNYNPNAAASGPVYAHEAPNVPVQPQQAGQYYYPPQQQQQAQQPGYYHPQQQQAAQPLQQAHTGHTGYTENTSSTPELK